MPIGSLPSAAERRDRARRRSGMDRGELRRLDGHPKDLLVAIARKYAIVIALLSVAVVLASSSSHFLTGLNLLNTVESGAIYGIVAIGLTVLMIGGEFDLCAGATFVLSGIVAAKLQPSIGSWPALAIGLLAGPPGGILQRLLLSALFLRSFVAH